MRPYRLAVLRSVALCALALQGMLTVTSCGVHYACAGQCAPPCELQVNFSAGTAHTTAQKVLTTCVDHNPVGIRITRLRVLGGGLSQSLIYTHAVRSARALELTKCLNSSGVAVAGWPS